MGYIIVFPPVIPLNLSLISKERNSLVRVRKCAEEQEENEVSKEMMALTLCANYLIRHEKNHFHSKYSNVNYPSCDPFGLSVGRVTRIQNADQLIN